MAGLSYAGTGRMAVGGGGFGTTSQRSWLGQTESQYDPLRDLQGRLASEQWDFQKRAYADQQRAARGSARSLSELISQYNQGTAAAKAANEQRYQQLLSIADQTTGQRAADIRSAGAAEESNVMQRLRALGMSGTTIAPTLKGGIKSRTEESLNRLADTMQQTKLGIIERREDEGPDPNIMLALAQQIGRAGGGALAGLDFGGSSSQFASGPTATSPRGVIAGGKGLKGFT